MGRKFRVVPVALIAIIILASFFPVSPKKALDHNVFPVFPLFSENPLLSRAARLKAQDMASRSYFAHTSPQGLTPWYWLEQVGYKYTLAGENLAVNFSKPSDITDAWLNSPAHRANILNSGYTETGTGTAWGFYKGKKTLFVVQFFGKPIAQTHGTMAYLY